MFIVFSHTAFFFWCSEIVFLKYSYSQPTFDEHVLISGFSVATGKMSQPNFFVLGAPGFSNKNGNIGAVSPKIKIDPALTFVKMCPRYKKIPNIKKDQKIICIIFYLFRSKWKFNCFDLGFILIPCFLFFQFSVFVFGALSQIKQIEGKQVYVFNILEFKIKTDM